MRPASMGHGAGTHRCPSYPSLDPCGQQPLLAVSYLCRTLAPMGKEGIQGPPFLSKRSLLQEDYEIISLFSGFTLSTPTLAESGGEGGDTAIYVKMACGFQLTASSE